MSNQINIDELKGRVLQFECMELPGQPRAMHMGTSYLVGDLWRAVQLLSKENKLPEVEHTQAAERERDEERRLKLIEREANMVLRKDRDDRARDRSELIAALTEAREVIRRLSDAVMASEDVSETAIMEAKTARTWLSQHGGFDDKG